MRGTLILCLLLTVASCSEQPVPSTKPAAPPAPAAKPAVEPPAQKSPAPQGPTGQPAPTAPAPAPTGAPPAPSGAPPAAPTGATPTAPATKAGEQGVTPIAETSKWLISVERAKELFDAKEIDGKQVIFVDARTFLEFRDDGHIRGAMHYSKDYTGAPPQAKVRNYLPGSAVVIYCHGELCTDSVAVGRYFESLKLDIGPVFIIKEGIPAWKKAYPNLVDKGPEVGFN